MQSLPVFTLREPANLMELESRYPDNTYAVCPRHLTVISLGSCGRKDVHLVYAEFGGKEHAGFLGEEFLERCGTVHCFEDGFVAEAKAKARAAGIRVDPVYKDVEAFHKARRMFMVFPDGTVLVAPKGDPRSHTLWLTDSFGAGRAEEMIDRFVRGYVLDHRLVSYIGDEFGADFDRQQAGLAWDLLSREYDIREMGFGAIPGPVQPWEPREVYPVPAHLR